MATGYWRGADNANWSTGTNWFDSITGPTTLTDATVPGAGNTAFFNANGTTTARTVYLNAPSGRSLGTFWMNGNAQGDITLRGGVSGGETTQTLTLGGIDMSGTLANSIWASSVNVALANNNFWNIGSGRAILVSGVVSGAFKLTSNNSGVIILGNANTYSGGTDITAGTVRVGASTTGGVTNGPLGTGTITMTGGKLSSDSLTARTLANALSLNGTITLCDTTNTGVLTFSGSTTIAGTTALTVAANTYVLMQGVFGGTGAFTLSSGELDLEGATGTKSGGTTIGGGTLYLGFGKTACDQLGTDSIAINSGSVYFCGSSNTTISSTITGSGGFLYARPRNAVVTLSNASAYAGTLRIFAGASDGVGTTTQGMTLSAFPISAIDFTFINQNTGTAVTQTFKYTGTASPGSVTPLASTITITPTVASSVGVWQHAPSNGTATMSIAGAITSNTSVAHTLQLTNDSSGLLAFSGGITQSGAGAMALTKTGTGPMTLSGAGTYTGTVTVSAGTLNANSTTALGAASSTAAISVANGATLSLGAALNYSSPGRSTSIIGTGVSTGGALVHAFAGTANVGAISLGADAYIRGTASGTSTLSSSFAVGTAYLTAGAASGNTLVLTGGIQSGVAGGGLIIGNSASDTGTVSLTTANTYQGNTTLSYGTLSLGNALALGSVGSLVFNGGTLDASSAGLTVANTSTGSANIVFAGTNALTLSGILTLSGSRTITTNGSGALTMSRIDGAGAKLTKAGTSSLILTGRSNYDAGTDIAAGTLLIQGSGGDSPTAAPGSGTITLDTPATGSNNTSLLIQAGATDLWLYRDITVANLGTGTPTIGSSGSTGGAYFVYTITLNRSVTIDTGSSGAVYLDGRYSANSLILAGTGNVTIAGSSFAYLTGSTSYAGSTTVNSGATLALQRNTDNPLPSGYDWNVNGTIRFEQQFRTQTIGALNGSGTVNFLTSVYPTLNVGSGAFSGTITGNVFGLYKYTSGGLSLSGNNDYTGATYIQAGVLTIGSNAAFGTSSVTLTGGTLAASGLRTINNALNVNGDCAFDVSSASAYLFQQTGAVTIDGARVVTVTGPSSGTQAVYWSGEVNATAGSSFTKAGTGCLSFSGTMKLTAVSVSAGRLLFNNAAADFNTPSVDVSSGATVVVGDGIGDSTLTLNVLTGAGSVSPEWGTSTTTRTLSVRSGTFTGTILDGTAGKNLALTKATSGTLTLSGANTFSGGTTVSAGTLQTGNVQALGTAGTVTLTASSATLQTLTTGGQNGKLTVAALNNAAGGTIKIGG